MASLANWKLVDHNGFQHILSNLETFPRVNGKASVHGSGLDFILLATKQGS